MIEIISIHIGRTAGSSFLEILKNQYGEENLYHYIDRRNPNSKIQLIKQYYKKKWTLNHLPKQYNVVHGHIYFEHVKKMKEKHDSKVIAWFRDPVERIISRYFFLMKRIEKNPYHPSKCFKDYSIIDFASRQSQQNVMSKYIQGIRLEELFFFGFQESFEHDVHELFEKLNLRKISIPKKLENKAYKSKNEHLITNEVITQLQELNSKDMELYQKALQLKNKSFTL